MNAQALILPLLLVFVNCFTKPGFEHFQSFIFAHAALFGIEHCVTDVMRLTQVHTFMHWTTPYAFLRKVKWSCPSRSPVLSRPRHALYKALRISLRFHCDPKTDEIAPQKEAA